MSFYDEIIFVFKNLENITIPQTIKQITPWSFYNSDATNVFIPKSVTQIIYSNSLIIDYLELLKHDLMNFLKAIYAFVLLHMI